MATAVLYNTDWCLSVAFVWCSYFLYNLDIDAYNSSMAIFCPASWLPLYHLASTWLQLPPISTPLLHGFICNTKLPSLHSIYTQWLCALNSNLLFPVPLLSSSQASTLCVVSGFLLSKVYALTACSPCTWQCVPLVDLLNGLLWAGRNDLPPTPDTLHLGCSYHLHSSHRFLSTCGAVMLEKKKKKRGV